MNFCPFSSVLTVKIAIHLGKSEKIQAHSEISSLREDDTSILHKPIVVHQYLPINSEITVKSVLQMHFCDMSDFTRYSEKRFIQVAKNRAFYGCRFATLIDTVCIQISFPVDLSPLP